MSIPAQQHVSALSVVLSLLAAQVLAGITNYVVPPGMSAPADPFTNWATASTNIQIAITAAQTNGGDSLVIATQGLYNISAGITISSGITVRSWHDGYVDQTNTIINGQGGAYRCVTINNSNAVLDGFTVSNGAGGISLGNSGGTVRNCRIVNNTAANGGGALIYNGRMEDSVIETNISTITGGGIYMASGTVYRCRVTANAANAPAGGIYIYNTGLVESCTIEANTARSAGGIYLYSNGTISNCSILANVVPTNATSGSGGGVYFECGGQYPGSALLANSIISSNVALKTGASRAGGVYAPQTNCIVRNCLISYNTANSSGGGADLWSTALIENCTLVNNKSDIGYGGGIFLGGYAQMLNCLVYYNSAGSGPNYYLYNTGRADFCCSYPMPSRGANNITNAPLMVDTNTGNFRLSRASLCINAGSNSPWMDSATDLDGRQRIMGIRGNNVDIGAYEYWVPQGTIMFSR